MTALQEPGQEPGLLARIGVPPLREVRATTGAVLVDTVGVGLMIPISLLFFTLTTSIPVVELGAALTGATVLSLPAGLIGGAITDRFGAKAAMVGNNLLSAAGYCLYLVAGHLTVVFLAMLLVAVADRMYWACWTSYVHALSDGRPFERWFAFLESIKAAAMGLGALIATLVLGVSTTSGARLLVVVNVLTSVAAAAMFVVQPMPGPLGDRGNAERARDARDAGEPGWQELKPKPKLNLKAELNLKAKLKPKLKPKPVRAAGGLRHVLTSRSGLLLVAAQFLTSPVMLLPSVVLPLLFVDRWHLPLFASTLFFGVSRALSALTQTPLSYAVRFRTRAAVIGVAMGLLAVELLLLAAVPAGHSWLSWTAVGLTAVVSAAVSALFMPASNALLAEAAPEAVRGRVIAVFQTASALGMALFPAGFSLVYSHFVTLPWVALAALFAAGGTCFARACARMPARARYPSPPDGLAEREERAAAVG